MLTLYLLTPDVLTQLNKCPWVVHTVNNTPGSFNGLVFIGTSFNAHWIGWSNDKLSGGKNFTQKFALSHLAGTERLLDNDLRIRFCGILASTVFTAADVLPI